MNERIKELAKQAYRADMLEENPAWKENEFTHMLLDELQNFFEKFAESIVKECAEVADNADATREKWEGIGKYVREHFGVE